MGFLLVPGSTGATVTAPDDFEDWVRNPSWLTLTPVTASEQKFRGLFGVQEGGGFVALTASGDYTVDWGDGTTSDHSAGTKASKEYTYSDVALAGTDAPVTLTDAGDLVERTAHGYVNGMKVQFFNVVTTTGLTNGRSYFVVNATTNNFQVSETAGGSPVALTNNGTANLLAHKQAIITVTPQAGQNLTALDLQQRHASYTIPQIETNWLDLEIGSPNFAAGRNLFIGNAASQVVFLRVCERVAIRNPGGLTSFEALCQNMSRLQSVVIEGATSAVTSVASMFSSCESLKVAPFFDTSAVTSFSSFCQSCGQLAIVPFYNTAAGTSFNFAFSSCRALKTLPAFNTSNGTNFASFCSNCSSLIEMPAIDLAGANPPGGTVTNMLFSCISLQRIKFVNLKLSLLLQHHKMSGAALDEFYTNLPVVAAGQTITLHNSMYGAASDTPSIATDKGWAVSG